MTKIRPEKTEQSLEVNVNNSGGFWNRLRRKRWFYPAVAVLGLASVMGTYGGQDGGATPFYVKKTGESFGMIGMPSTIVTNIDRYSEFTGTNISLFKKNTGTFRGINLSLIDYSVDDIERAKNNDKSEETGLSLAILGHLTPDSANSQPGTYNGIQAGIFLNMATVEKAAVQIGLFNFIYYDERVPVRNYEGEIVTINGGQPMYEIERKRRFGFLFNYRFNPDDNINTN
ncbi:hypothetical protein J4405_00575 [Candidatus Woesearchaeota archaeon]|nr:hypothetical protein [Candidatus Woesearchaeota archaeon]